MPPPGLPPSASLTSASPASGTASGQTAFGRRRSAQPQQAPQARPADPFEPPTWDFADKRTAAFAAELARAGDLGDPDAEAVAFANWKASRKRALPWRQISLMAGLSFGLAGLVLPESVNDWASWIMYGLMAMAFYVGLKAKREKKA